MKRPLLLTVAAVAVLALAVVGGLWIHFSKEPPALTDSTLHRVTPLPSNNGANRNPLQNIRVGSHVLSAELLAVSDDTSARMFFRTGINTDGEAPIKRGLFHPGDTIRLDGLTITIERIWKMPTRSKSAVDLRVSERG